MRTLWLASTALLITTGIAFAQSTQTASPAPAGAVNSPQVSPSGSPGKMAPAPSNSPMSAMSSAPSNGSAPSPAPTGAVGAPDVAAGAAPGTSPGKMAPAPNGINAAGTGSMASTTKVQSAPGPMYSHHHWSTTSMLPQNASATTYLHIAKTAISHHNLSLADDALSHAETRLLDRAVPQGQISPDDSPTIQSIESARQALHAGNYSQASADTKQAASTASSM